MGRRARFERASAKESRLTGVTRHLGRRPCLAATLTAHSSPELIQESTFEAFTPIRSATWGTLSHSGPVDDFWWCRFAKGVLALLPQSPAGAQSPVP